MGGVGTKSSIFERPRPCIRTVDFQGFPQADCRGVFVWARSVPFAAGTFAAPARPFYSGCRISGGSRGQWACTSAEGSHLVLSAAMMIGPVASCHEATRNSLRSARWKKLIAEGPRKKRDEPSAVIGVAE